MSSKAFLDLSSINQCNIKYEGIDLSKNSEIFVLDNDGICTATGYETQPYIGPWSQKSQGVSKYAKVCGYKYIKNENLKFWKDGYIRIGTLNNFAGLDGFSSTPVGGVGDIEEVELKIGDVFVPNTNDPDYRLVRNYLIREKIIGERTTLRNTVVKDFKIYKKNRFVFCLSSSYSKSAFEKWHQAEGYDMVLRIDDVLNFATAIQAADRRQNQRFFLPPSLDWVEYFERPFDRRLLGSRGPMKTLVFFKDKNRFAWQDEIRLAWGCGGFNDRPGLPLNTSNYDLNIPNLSDHFEVFKYL